MKVSIGFGIKEVSNQHKKNFLDLSKGKSQIVFAER